jgi:hypothetical protein
MPYIKQEARGPLLPHGTPQDAGELNYAFTAIIVQYMRTKGLRYQHINDVMGALFGAALEFYIRIVRPYEDLKIEENGDVYGPLLKLLEEAAKGKNLRKTGIQLSPGVEAVMEPE